MLWLITKYLTTAALVVVITELAKRSDKLGGLVAALPLVTILTLIWLQIENQPESKIANHAWIRFGMSCPRCRCSWPFRYCYHAWDFG